MKRLDHLLGAVAQALVLGATALACADDPSLIGGPNQNGGGGAGGSGGTAGQHCGDGVLAQGEACDREDLGGASCTSLGYDGGTLRCDAWCRQDTGGCVRFERCDNGVDDDRDGLIDCADADCTGTAPCPRCGDDTIDPGEECDGTELGGASCESLGFAGGTLACGALCRFDDADCARLEDCENGLDDDGNGAVDCEDDACRGAPPCPYCGDGILNQPEEACDGGAVEASCADFGYPLGNVSCSTACTLDLSGCGFPEDCQAPGDEDENGLSDCDDPACAGIFECPLCGDGILQQGESCDVGTLAGCTDFGFDAGSTTCSSCSVDTSGCRNVVCGDGFVDADERCDPAHPVEGADCTGSCVVVGDVCSAPQPLAWHAASATWRWDGTTNRYHPDYDAHCPQMTATPDAIASFTAPSDGRYFARVTAAFDAVLAAWVGTCDGGPLATACTDDWGEKRAEVIELELQAGDPLYLLVGLSNAGGWSGVGDFVVEVGTVACGNGRREGLEQCEDGNLADGDGCSALCRWEGDDCADAYDLNLNGTPKPNWPEWFTRGNDRWLWEGDIGLASDDYVGGCRAAVAPDRVARFVAPAAGRYYFFLFSEFDSELYALDQSCVTPIHWGQLVSMPLCSEVSWWPLPGQAQVVTRGYQYDMEAGEEIRLVVEGGALPRYGSTFWLYAESNYRCGDGVVDPAEYCDDGNDDPSDGCWGCSMVSVAEPRIPLPPNIWQIDPGLVLVTGSPWTVNWFVPREFAFQAEAGVTYRLWTERIKDFWFEPVPDTILRVLDVHGNVLAENDDRSATDVTSLIDFTAPAAGVYYAEVFTSPKIVYPPTFEGRTFAAGTPRRVDEFNFGIGLEIVP